MISVNQGIGFSFPEKVEKRRRMCFLSRETFLNERVEIFRG